jgi:HYR domain
MPRPKIKPAFLALLCFILGGPVAGAAPPTLAKPEIISAPASWTKETAATVVFTSSDEGVGFECRLDGSPWESCASPTTYSSLAEGSHSFSVHAIDGEATSTPENWSWKVDLTAPGVPGDKTEEATSPLGTPVSFSATDNLDPSPALTCSPPSGSVFDLGPPTNVTCTAVDAAGNETTGGFTVTVVDTTPPILAPHGDVVASQESPAGAVVHYDLPLVTDNGDPAPLVSCAPTSGSTFPLGTTQVACSARDASNNEGDSSEFNVVVQHGATPDLPRLESNVGTLTNDTTVTFSFGSGDGASLSCKLDEPSGAGEYDSCTSPLTFTGLEEGNYLFTVRATNSIGNISEASWGWVVDTTPPGEVRRLTSSFGNAWVRLSWRNPTDVDFRHVSIWRRKVGATSSKLIATRKARTFFRDETVQNDTRYIYALRTVDRVRNVSRGERVESRASKILKPAFDSVHDSPPLIDWTSVRSATYFNLQLWRDGRKILSAWPSRSAFRLPAKWRYSGTAYSLRSDRYRVYVWPGFGLKSAVDYGRLLGWTAFRMK